MSASADAAEGAAVEGAGGPAPLLTAESFSRRTSWRFRRDGLPEAERLPVTDVDQMAKYNLAFDLLLAGDAVGSTASLAKLQSDIDASLSQDRCDTYLVDPLKAQLKAIGLTLQALAHTRISTSSVPTDFMQRALRNAEYFTEEVRRRLADGKQVQQQQVSLTPSVNAKLSSLVQLELEPRFMDELLPSGGGRKGSGFREGWQDEWWQANRRIQAAKVLEEKRKQWARDTELDRLGEETCGLLREQVKCCHTQLDGVGELSRLQQIAPAPPAEVTRQIQALDQENARLREDALEDVKKVDALAAEVEAKDRAAIEAFQQGVQYAAQFLQDNALRLQAIEAQIRSRDTRFQEEREVLILTGGKLGENATALALQQEVVALRVLLKEKEEELAREVDRWSQLQMEQETELKAAFEARMAELEAAFKGDMAELQAIRDLLKTEGATVERLIPQREHAEKARRQETAAVLEALRGRREALEITAAGYADLLTTSKLVREVHDTLYTATGQMLEERWQEAVCGEVDLQLQGLEVGGKFHKVLMTLDANLKVRLASVDRMVSDLNKLIEFSVDTYDPNAHLYKDALEDALDVRRKVQKSILENAAAHGWLRREAAAFYQTLNASAMLPQDSERLQRLQRLYRDFFDVLPARAGEEPPPVEVRFYEAPRSQFVTTLRKPVDPPAPLAAQSPGGRPKTADPAFGFQRLPMLGGQQWALEPTEDQRSLSPLAPVGARPQTATARLLGLPSSPQRVQQDFDHREFLVYKNV